MLHNLAVHAGYHMISFEKDVKGGQVGPACAWRTAGQVGNAK